MNRPSGLERIAPEHLNNLELDMHMGVDHDRDSGERGREGGRAGQVATHLQLHKTGVWSKIPHTHNGSMPFGGQT